MYRSSWLIFAFLAIRCSVIGAAEESTTTVLDAPAGRKVEITTPADWQIDKIPPIPELHSGAGISLTSDDDREFILMISVNALENVPFDTQDKIDEMVKLSAEHYAATSVEKELKVKKIESKNGLGAYVQLTDASLVGKELQQGQFRTVTSGIMVVGKTSLTFTVLVNSFDQPKHQEAIRVIEAGIRAVP